MMTPQLGTGKEVRRKGLLSHHLCHISLTLITVWIASSLPELAAAGYPGALFPEGLYLRRRCKEHRRCSREHLALVLAAT